MKTVNKMMIYEFIERLLSSSDAKVCKHWAALGLCELLEKSGESSGDDVFHKLVEAIFEGDDAEALRQARLLKWAD